MFQLGHAVGHTDKKDMKQMFKEQKNKSLKTFNSHMQNQLKQHKVIYPLFISNKCQLSHKQRNLSQ